MWIKMAGLLCMAVACGGLGADAAMRLRRRLRLLEKMKLMVSHLKGEILYANAPLTEAFKRTGSRNPGEVGDLFLRVSSELDRESGESFSQIWERESRELGGAGVLSEKEREQLQSFGCHLGYLDRGMQEKTIELYLEDLDQCISELRKQEPEKRKLFLSLGVLSGLFLIVVLI